MSTFNGAKINITLTFCLKGTHHVKQRSVM
jgi:hypothetical protein